MAKVSRRTRRGSRSRLVGMVALAGLTLSGCASDAPLDTLDPQGPIAEDIHNNLVIPVFALAGIVLVIIMVLAFWLPMRGRVIEYADDEWPEQVHHNTILEVGVTGLFVATMIFTAVITIDALFDLDSTKANAMEVAVDGDEVMWEPTVVVVGNQWWWEFRYYFNDQVTLTELRETASARDLPPADIVTSGQMMIPTNQEIELIITSRDVIHSFWIPALIGKRDAAPGRFHPWKVEASDPGFYFGQCTEFCGLSHSRMRMQVVALEPGDFQTWVDQVTQDAEEPTEGSAADGLSEFRGNCTSCHLIEGVNDDTYEGADQESNAAPNLTHFASRSTFAGGILNTYNTDGSLNRVDLEAWLRDPGEIKANYTVAGQQFRGMPDLNLSEQQIDDLVAYLAGLGEQPASWVIEATEVE